MQLGSLAFRCIFLGLWVGGFACHSGSSSSENSSASIEILSFAPTEGETNVELDALIQVQFATPIIAESLPRERLSVYLGQNEVAGAVFLSKDQATFHPTNPFRSNLRYRAVLSPGVKSIAGAVLKDTREWSFTTVDRERPTVVSVNPFQSLQFADLQKILIQFSEEMDPATLNSNTILLNNANGAVPGDIFPTGYAYQVAFYPQRIDSELLHTLRISSAAKDLSGNALLGNQIAGDYVISFTSRDSLPPTLVSSNPAAGSTGVGPATVLTLSATFDDSLVSGVPSAGWFSLRDIDSNVAIPGTVSVSGSTLNFSLSGSGAFSSLLSNTNYQVTLSSAIQDNGGNPLANDIIIPFSIRTGWGLQIPVETHSLDIQNPQIAYNPASDRFQAVWQVEQTPGAGIYSIFTGDISRYPDLSQPVQLDLGQGNAVNPQLAVADNGARFFVWAQDFQGGTSGSINNICLAEITSNGAVSTATVIDNDGSLGAEDVGRAPQIAIAPAGTPNAGTPYVIFSQTANGSSNYNLYFTKRNANGTWSTPVVIDNDGAATAQAVFGPQIAIAPVGTPNAGTVYVIFRQNIAGTGSNFSILVREISPNHAVGSIFTMEANANDAVAQQLLVDLEGTVHVCFRQKTAPNSNYQIFHNRIFLDTASGNWTVGSTTEIDGTPTGDADGPQIAVGPENSLYLVYRQRLSASANYSVLVSEAVAPSTPGGPRSWQAPLEIDFDAGTANTSQYGCLNPQIIAFQELPVTTPGPVTEGMVVVTFPGVTVSTGLFGMVGIHKRNGAWNIPTGGTVPRALPIEVVTEVDDDSNGGTPAGANNIRMALRPFRSVTDKAHVRGIWQHQIDNPNLSLYSLLINQFNP